VGAPGDDQGGNFAGAAYVVLGPVSGTRDLSLADAKLVGQRGSETGISLSSAGDVDADGHADVLIGAPFNDQGGWIAGAAYVVLGPVTATRDLEDADAKILGEEGVNAGGSVSGLGDVNLDGHDDLVIGAFGGSPDYEGATYVVLGPVTGTVRPEGADVKLIGEVSDHAGMAVAGAGDVDGDGRGDVLVGSIHDFGTAYLVYGEGL
jgi:hypothetical protein